GRLRMRLNPAFLRKGTHFAVNYITRYFHKGRFTAPAAPRLSIETTNICNAKCVFCANPVMQRQKQGLPMDLFRKAVDELAATGATRLDFNVTIGDPLLDPKILERARYVRRYPQFDGLGFVTTLQWLHKFNLDEFFDSGITWVSVSTSLSGRQSYLEFFGVDKYDQMLQNLETLLIETNKRGRPIDVYIGIKPTNESEDQVLRHPDFLRISNLTEQDLVAGV